MVQLSVRQGGAHGIEVVVPFHVRSQHRRTTHAGRGHELQIEDVLPRGASDCLGKHFRFVASAGGAQRTEGGEELIVTATLVQVPVAGGEGIDEATAESAIGHGIRHGHKVLLAVA